MSSRTMMKSMPLPTISGGGGWPGQLGPDPGRAVVGVEVHTGAEAEQTPSGRCSPGRFPLWMTPTAPRRTLSAARHLSSSCWLQRVAVLCRWPRRPSRRRCSGRCGRTFRPPYRERAEGLLHDLGAGAVAPDDSNVFSILMGILSFIGRRRQVLAFAIVDALDDLGGIAGPARARSLPGGGKR